MMRIVGIIIAVLVTAAAGAAGFVWSGWYDISANVQHTQPVYSLLEYTMHRSVLRRAKHITVPPLNAPEQLARGAICYRDKCVDCHGGPGVAQGEIGRSMQPLPGPLVDAAARWRAQELYWITRNGIKMSGMPAWQYRLPDADLWSLVAFLERLPRMTSEEFSAAAGPSAQGDCLTTGSEPVGTPGSVARAPAIAAMPRPLTTGVPVDAQRGRVALTQYACNACHLVPGVTGSKVYVGPPLAGIASRTLIAGSLPNTSEQMVRWIMHPRTIDPQTTMPDMAVTERDARDIAAYLGTLR